MREESICPLSVLLALSVLAALRSALSRVIILMARDRLIKNQCGNVVHLEDNERKAQDDAQQVGIVMAQGQLDLSIVFIISHVLFEGALIS